MLIYWRFDIENYMWKAQVCLITSIWMNWMKLTYLYMTDHMQNINIIPKFIIINSIPRFISTCCFQSLWAHPTTQTWNDWINLLVLLIPYHMLTTNFITQLIIEIKLTHYSASLWECPGVSGDTHLKQPTNNCCFHGPLFTCKNPTSYLQFICEIF